MFEDILLVVLASVVVVIWWEVESIKINHMRENDKHDD